MRRRCLIDAETTSCVYWVIGLCFAHTRYEENISFVHHDTVLDLRQATE